MKTQSVKYLRFPPGTFVWLKVKDPDGSGRLPHVVGQVCRDGALIQRLWAMEVDGGGHQMDDIYSPDRLEPWLRLPGSDTIPIAPDHPAYDRWWAWYVACQLNHDNPPLPPLSEEPL